MHSLPHDLASLLGRLGLPCREGFASCCDGRTCLWACEVGDIGNHVTSGRVVHLPDGVFSWVFSLEGKGHCGVGGKEVADYGS